MRTCGCNSVRRACALIAAAIIASGCNYASMGPNQSAPPAPVAATASPPEQTPIQEPLRSGLARENYYRALLKLPPVAEDRALSKGAEMHARYVVKNHLRGGEASLSNGRLGINRPDSEVRREDPKNPWYTEAGANAANISPYVMTGSVLPDKGEFVVDQVLTLPFSAILALDPQVSAIGYGQYCEAQECAAVLSIKHGLDKPVFASLYEGAVARLWNPANGPMPLTPARLRVPLEFPPPGATVELTSYAGNGWPDPLMSCAGYEVPTGPPIILELGQGLGANGMVEVDGHSLSDGKDDLSNCLLDSTSFYPNEQRQQDQALAEPSQPPTNDQEKARQEKARMARDQRANGSFLLGYYGAVIMIPRAPLKPGSTYTVSITADSKRYDWSFAVAASAK